MFFTILVFLAALALEVIGTYISVIGMSSIFANSYIIVAFVCSLDFAQLVGISFLYKKWGKINLALKIYMTLAAIVLMIITSTGAFGYLSGQFQKSIADTNQDTVIVKALTDEQARLQKRKEEIDKQIAQLPGNNVKGRTQLIRNFAPEVTRLNSRLTDIDKQLPDLKVNSIKKQVEVGPIIYIAEAFDTTPEKAVKWVIFTIISVFNPLAIALLLAGNFLIAEMEDKKKEIKKDIVIKNDELSDEFDDYPKSIVKSEHDDIIPEDTWVHHEENFPPIEEVVRIEEPISEEPVIIEPSPEVVDTNHIIPEMRNFFSTPTPVENPKVHEIEPSPELLAHLSDEELHAHLGRERFIDTSSDKKTEREIITVDQVKGVDKPPRSSLEDIDNKMHDIVEMTIGNSDDRGIQNLRNIYDTEPVTVGGPPTRR